MSSVGVGIVGSGYMALTYAESLSRYVRGGRLVAIGGGSRAAALAADYGVAAHPTLEALLADPAVEALVITTPDQAHCEQTLAAAAAGRHVLVEKPMAPSVAQCDEMIAACEAAGVRLAVVKTERYRGTTTRARALIDEGRIGEVRMLTTTSCFPEGVAAEIFASRPWYLDPAGGGLFMSMASHNADMLLWLVGRPATTVYAQARTYGGLQAPNLSVMAQIGFAGGAMAQMLISSELPPPSLRSSEVRFQVVGSRGLLDFENYEFLDLGAGEGWERRFTPPRFDYVADPKSPQRLEPHIGVVQGFVDSILADAAPPVGGADGRAAVAICEACLRSAAEGRPVTL
jgi:predicted dehydrogenase